MQPGSGETHVLYVPFPFCIFSFLFLGGVHLLNYFNVAFQIVLVMI